VTKPRLKIKAHNTAIQLQNIVLIDQISQTTSYMTGEFGSNMLGFRGN